MNIVLFHNLTKKMDFYFAIYYKIELLELSRRTKANREVLFKLFSLVSIFRFVDFVPIV